MKWTTAIVVLTLMFLATVLVVFSMLYKPPRFHHPPHTIELDKLCQAIQSYKEAQTEFPPCMAENSPDRKQRFMRHMQLAYANSAYGVGNEAFDRLNVNIGNKWNYNFLKPDGSFGTLDLETLDPAEALVFWLGGFPTPIDHTTKQPIATRKLFGFHRDSDDPLKRDIPSFESPDPLRYRTDPLFRFNETRLVDSDHDGWWEYMPYPPRDGGPTAPYVYFDAQTYVETTKDPKQLGNCFYPHDVTLAKQWGTAIPYLSLSPASIADGGWAKPDHFQIVCAGLDGLFGPRGDGANLPTPRLTTYDSLQTFSAADGFQGPHDADEAELDNLTNLSSKPLGAMRP